MVDFEAAIRYPTEHEDWIVTVLIGGILVILGFLVIPWLLVVGFVLRVMKETIGGSETPPEFGEWVDLLVDGVKATIIWVIYLLIPAIVLMVTMGGILIAGLTGPDPLLGPALADAFIGLLIATLVTLVFAYLGAAAVVNFAKTDELRAAVAFDRLTDVILTSEYAVAWILAFVVWIVAGFVSSIPVVGWLLSPFVSFYIAMVAARLLAEGFEEGLAAAAGT